MTKVKEFPPHYYVYDDEDGETYSAHFVLDGEMINLYCFTVDQIFEEYICEVENFLKK